MSVTATFTGSVGEERLRFNFMDYNNDNNNGEPWDWQKEDYCLEKNSNLDVAHPLWNEVSTNEEDLSYMFDESTPIKACGDLAYHVADSEKMIKEPKECRETSSQVKRRRMLQFNTDMDQPLCNKDMSSPFLRSKEVEEPVDETLSEVSQWTSEFTEDVSASGYEGLDQDSWLAQYFNDVEMNFSPDDINFSEPSSDLQMDMSEFCQPPPEYEANMVQECATRTPRKIIFRGRKSFIRTPTNVASSIAYPFAFIKPCGVHGDVTLKDINQRILTPPPSKSKQIDEDPACYPTSAFSGKPVVGKTKIRTEGGKGSITIMRTKG